MVNLDNTQTIILHKNLLQKKKFLRNFYEDIYRQFKLLIPKKGFVVEIGSGAGFIKDVIPQVITSDVIYGPGIDKVFLAEKMPFKNDSIDAFLMFDVFHHIKDPEKALKEMQRCLKKGGKIIMLEPFNSPWSRFIYQNFHHENFDPKAGWKIKGKRRLSDANIALPWIIFFRDRDTFGKKFPYLKIKYHKPQSPFLYLFSGGLSKPQFAPDFSYPIIKAIEKILSPFNKFMGLFFLIGLEKA